MGEQLRYDWAVDVKSLAGSEPFRGGGAEPSFSVGDYWSWAYSNVLNNTDRGVLAEFLVGHALGVVDKPRVEWDEKDLVYRGKGVEVKSSAYCQAWTQKEASTPQFDVAAHLGWDAATNTSAETARRAADVYVFCLLAEKDKRKVDPLDLSQWKFWVVATRTLNSKLKGQKVAGLGTIERVAGAAVGYGGLKGAVDEALKDV